MTPTAPALSRRTIVAEVVIVLAVTFGMSGVRSLLRLIDSVLSPVALNQQQVTLNSTQSQFAWLDVALQLCSAGVLFAWGALALYLLRSRPRRCALADAALGAGLAALIGIPGLAFYAVALHQGWTKEVIPGSFSNPWVEVPAQLLWAGANAFGEEVVVVFWLTARLSALVPHAAAARNTAPAPASLGWPAWAAIAASAVLRGSYHLYQGVSAGFGNLAMGLIFGYFYHRTGHLWPLVVAHFLIDAVAFVGYALIGNAEFLRW